MLQCTRFGCLVIAVLFCAAMAGCQKEGVEAGFPAEKARGGIEVKGRLLEGGQPASMPNYLDGYNYYTVTLVPEGAGEQGMCAVAQDGTFAIPGMQPGKYKVGVAKIVTGQEAEDEWKGKFAADKSKLTVDVAEGQELTIDLKQLEG